MSPQTTTLTTAAGPHAKLPTIAVIFITAGIGVLQSYVAGNTDLSPDQRNDVLVAIGACQKVLGDFTVSS